MDGWVEGWKSRVKDCLQQSKIQLYCCIKCTSVKWISFFVYLFLVVWALNDTMFTITSFLQLRIQQKSRFKDQFLQQSWNRSLPILFILKLEKIQLIIGFWHNKDSKPLINWFFLKCLKVKFYLNFFDHFSNCSTFKS